MGSGEGVAVWEAGGSVFLTDIEIPIPGIGTPSINKSPCLHLQYPVLGM